ncbi:hypothetical protein ACFQ4J_15185 [Laceyella tengchongensis]|jgi:hypothetical protein
MKPIRCLACYEKRLGGRCDFCPLHKKNKSSYRHIGEGWYVPLPQTNSFEIPAPGTAKSTSSKKEKP